MLANFSKSDIDMFYIFFISFLIIQILCKNIQCKSFIDRDAKSMCIHPTYSCSILQNIPSSSSFYCSMYLETGLSLNSFFKSWLVNLKERSLHPHQILLSFYSQQYRIATPIIWHQATNTIKICSRSKWSVEAKWVYTTLVELFSMKRAIFYLFWRCYYMHVW